MAKAAAWWAAKKYARRESRDAAGHTDVMDVMERMRMMPMMPVIYVVPLALGAWMIRRYRVRLYISRDRNFTHASKIFAIRPHAVFLRVQARLMRHGPESAFVASSAAAEERMAAS